MFLLVLPAAYLGTWFTAGQLCFVVQSVYGTEEWTETVAISGPMFSHVPE